MDRQVWANNLSQIRLLLYALLYVAGCGIQLYQFLIIMSPTERGGGHIVFGADPVGVGISVDVGFLFARYLMNQWVDFN